MLAYPGADLVDIAGPLDILCGATALDGTSPPRPHLVSTEGGALVTEPTGLVLHTEPMASVARRPIDTLIIPGGLGLPGALADTASIAWIRRTAERARRIVSVCTGAFLLAEAGVLDGRRATTHWAYVEDFAARYPAVQVEPDAIFVVDEPCYTSAGITAGMDLALHLVERDHGAARALAVARYWLIYARRPGGQSQFSPLLPARAVERRSIADLQAWILANLRADLSVEALAARLAMSPRHFARVFRAETGMTPARFVETARVEAARRWLESGTSSIDRVAADSGMGDSERLRRSFVRRLGVNPRDYRSRFAGPDDGLAH
jgi:transcriptional regulator GlxA family with amidase domain